MLAAVLVSWLLYLSHKPAALCGPFFVLVRQGWASLLLYTFFPRSEHSVEAEVTQQQQHYHQQRPAAPQQHPQSDVVHIVVKAPAVRSVFRSSCPSFALITVM
jgi:hypothetical protein